MPLGQPFTFVDVEGRGHLVGVALQAQGSEPGQTYFFEGDDEATIDGELSIHGTGSEDFFNGGWYDIPGRWNGRLSLPLSGSLDYQKSMGRTGGYRLMLSDAYAFRKSLKLTIEHGPEGNLVPADYTAMSYFYLQRPPLSSPGLANVNNRAVSDPDRLVFVPGWNEPIYAFSFEKHVAAQTGNEARWQGRAGSLNRSSGRGEVRAALHCLFCADSESRQLPCLGRSASGSFAGDRAVDV